MEINGNELSFAERQRKAYLKEIVLNGQEAAIAQKFCDKLVENVQEDMLYEFSRSDMINEDRQKEAILIFRVALKFKSMVDQFVNEGLRKEDAYNELLKRT
jgi:hypothetical protein